MTDTEILKAAKERDATAFIALADAAGEDGHPHAEELVSLARDIVTETDWSIVLLAMCVFEQLLEDR